MRGKLKAGGRGLILFLVSWAGVDAVSGGTQAQEKTNLAEKSITTAPGKVGELLRLWWKEGTAAGNVGDFYDNRDGSHSDLNMAPYPQLQKIVYSEDDIKFRRHWAAQRVLLPRVVFGNSSTSAPPTAGGSNPRMYYVNPAGVAFLYRQYTGNNLYIYPEHRDHDPGRNGPGENFGDLYPTNTPYLLISQGSSGSDQPFMRAIPFTLAAFRPEVKKKLTETGLLMPTIQMLLRKTYKPAQGPNDYLTGKAHPTVFEGSGVDDLALVKAAHDLALDSLPPMIQLKVLEEDEPRAGRDFFDVHPNEKLADTPAVIARIWRGKEHKRRLVVSAESSVDVNKKPLTFHWSVLRGDEKRVQITPKNAERSVVEIVVSYHERRPIAPGSNLESNRVDLGVFAHNGTHHSAPGFVTFFTLDNEGRTYDEQGRILEIGYEMTEVRPSVLPGPFLELLARDGTASRLLGLGKEDRERLIDARPRFEELNAAAAKAVQDRTQLDKEWDALLKRLKEAGEDEKLLARKKELEQERKAAQAKATAADKTLQEFVDKVGVRRVAEQALARLLDDPETLTRLLKEAGTAAPSWTFQRKTPTPYEKMHVARLHAQVLAEVFRGAVTFGHHKHFVDPRLTAPRAWRDVYRYDARGRFLGWTRHLGDRTHEFNRDGLLIVEKDDLGRAVKAKTVTYVQDPPAKMFLNTNPLKMVEGDPVVYTFRDADDIEGTRK